MSGSCSTDPQAERADLPELPVGSGGHDPPHQDSPWSDSSIQRIRARLGPPTTRGCLEFQGWRNQRGYGKAWVDGQNRYTHRVLYEQHIGRRLDPLEIVMHWCDNPSCCNVYHLHLGDLKANAQDSVAKGRFNQNRKPRKRLSVDQVLQIKLWLRAGQTIGGIAAHTGRAYQTIRDIRDNNTWRNVVLPSKQSFDYDPFADE